jgi:hypothetical protein
MLSRAKALHTSLADLHEQHGDLPGRHPLHFIWMGLLGTPSAAYMAGYTPAQKISKIVPNTSRLD